MHSDAWEAALSEQAVELGGTHSALYEYDGLIVLQLIEQVVETTILLTLAKLNVVLLETVKCELLLIINVDLEGILHKLLADWASSWGKRCREHHNLLLSWCGAEDLLNIAAHVWKSHS